MTSKEWQARFDDPDSQVDMRAVLSDLASLESFCEGLKGVNDDLRGKLTACEQWNRALLAEAREEGKPDEGGE